MSDDSGGTVWSLIGMLLVVILILVLAYVVTRWVASRGARHGCFSGASSEGKLQILAELPVGRGERILLIRLMEKCLVLGVTAGQITVLCELEGEEAAEWFRDDRPKTGFLEALQANLRKKK